MSSYSNLKFEVKLFSFIIFLKVYILSNHINKNVDFKQKKNRIAQCLNRYVGPSLLIFVANY